jgi:hypothetical protein
MALIKIFITKMYKIKTCSSNFLAESSDMGCRSLELHGEQLLANSEIRQMHRLSNNCQLIHFRLVSNAVIPLRINKVMLKARRKRS